MYGATQNKSASKFFHSYKFHCMKSSSIDIVYRRIFQLCLLTLKESRYEMNILSNLKKTDLSSLFKNCCLFCLNVKRTPTKAINPVIAPNKLPNSPQLVFLSSKFPPV